MFHLQTFLPYEFTNLIHKVPYSFLGTKFDNIIITSSSKYSSQIVSSSSTVTTTTTPTIYISSLEINGQTVLNTVIVHSAMLFQISVSCIRTTLPTTFIFAMIFLIMLNLCILRFIFTALKLQTSKSS